MSNKYGPVDEWGIPSWPVKVRGGAAMSSAPFETMLADRILDTAPPLKEAAIYVHDQIAVAQAICLSVFGPAWRDHVWHAFDRLVRREQLTLEASTQRVEPDNE